MKDNRDTTRLKGLLAIAETGTLSEVDREVAIALLEREQAAAKARHRAETGMHKHIEKQVAAKQLPEKQRKSWVVEVFEQVFGKELNLKYTEKELKGLAYYREQVKRKQRKAA